MIAAMTPAERRRALIDDLRNLPPEWQWDFGDGDCCAIGRAHVIGLAPRYDIGIPHAQYGVIFGFPNYGWAEFYGVRSHSEVTPQMVADALEGIVE